MSLLDYQSRGLLELLDVELARHLSRMTGSPEPEVELAIALTSRNIRRGHSCFPLGTSARELWPTETAPPDELPARDDWIRMLGESRLTRGGPLVLDSSGRLYLRRYWQLEHDIARELAARSGEARSVADDSHWLAARLDALFPGDPSSPQRQAARNAVRHQVSLLCGGPGTGKTTTVASIVALLVDRALRDTGTIPSVMLLAPTGKSAARLGEAVRQAKSRIRASDQILDGIPEEAITVHRALRMQRHGMRFQRSADLPLAAEIIVVDEASMVDLALMRHLLSAAPARATVLIVGDPDQLSSVEAGSVLRDLVRASETTWWRDRVTVLGKTYRYHAEEPLGRLVSAIRMGDASAVSAVLSHGDGNVSWSASDALPSELDRAAKNWADVLGTLDPEAHFDRRGRYVVLSPFRKGLLGTARLGLAIQERLRAFGMGAPRTTPIIFEENNHELGVSNGDFGMLVGGETPTAIVRDGADGFRHIAESLLPRFSNAFALSIHKSQGSEFDEVLVLLPQEDAPLLTRELLYTAVSRARNRVRIVGPMKVVTAALERSAQRHSGLIDAIATART